MHMWVSIRMLWTSFTHCSTRRAMPVLQKGLWKELKQQGMVLNCIPVLAWRRLVRLDGPGPAAWTGSSSLDHASAMAPCGGQGLRRWPGHMA